MLTELPCSIEKGPIGFFNGFQLLLGIANSSMYVGTISLTGFFNIVNLFNAVVLVAVTVLESENIRFGYQ